MKKGLNKTLVIVIICIVFVLGIVGLIVSKSNKPENPVKEKSIAEQIKDIMDISYVYYTLNEKPIEKSEDYLIYGEDKYYYILTDKVKSIDDINNLIDELFMPTSRELVKTELFNKREFKEDNGKIYIKSKKENDGCKLNYDLKNKKYSYKIVGEILNITIGDEETSHTFPLYKTDEGYRVYVSLYDCKNNIKKPE